MIVNELIDGLKSKDINRLSKIIQEDCLLVLYNQTSLLGKNKVIQYLKKNKNKLKTIHLLNSVRDGLDTYLISFSIEDKSGQLFGSSVLRFTQNDITKSDEINFVKVFLVL